MDGVALFESCSKKIIMCGLKLDDAEVKVKQGDKKGDEELANPPGKLQIATIHQHLPQNLRFAAHPPAMVHLKPC